ncbi:MAG: hypothetical protein JKY70_21985 [Mucilaginibacter sp.]|nr:hypothetical protein [Mucilaginibacter sp.]
MKNLIVRMALPCLVLSALATLNSCKKESQLSEGIQQNVNDSALLATSTPTVSYTVSTLVARSQDLKSPNSICSASDGTVYSVKSSINYPGIVKIGTDGGYTKYLDYDGIISVKAGANGSLYFLKNYVINNFVLDSFNVFKVDRNKKVTMIPVQEKLSHVSDFAIGPDSSLYLSEIDNCRIIKITKEGVQSVFGGKKGVKGYADGPRGISHFTYPTQLKFGEDGNLWVLDGAVYHFGQRIRKVSMDGAVTTLFTLKYNFQQYNSISAFAVTKRDKNFNLTPNQNVFFFVRGFTGADKTVQYNQLFHLSNTKVLTSMGPNLPEGTNADPFEHDGSLQVATFNLPYAMTINPKGIFVADFYGNSIRKIERQ